MKTKPRLDYLFEADFVDGTTYFQGNDDESINHAGKSAYTDVRERMGEVKRFHLVGNGDRYTVDLTDGHFEINQVPFNVERRDLPLTDIKLRFLRYTNVESTVQATSDDKGVFNWRGSKEVARSHYVDRYVIGFTALQGGEEIEQSIAIRGGA